MVLCARAITNHMDTGGVYQTDHHQSLQSGCVCVCVTVKANHWVTVSVHVGYQHYASITHAL